MANLENISPGQNQVWNIAKELLYSYAINPTITSEESTNAYSELMARIKEDKDVTSENDFTGVPIIKRELSNTYLELIGRESKEAEPGSMHNFDFNKMIFHGSSIGSWFRDTSIKVYHGGSRPLVTARAILTLVSGNNMYIKKPMHLKYYLNSGAMEIFEGNHRSLAYKLLGMKNFPLPIVSFYEDREFDEPLNTALLGIEGLLGGIEPKFKIDANSPSIVNLASEFGIFDNIELNQLYIFTREDLSKRNQYCSHDVVTIDDLKTYLNAYSTVMDSPKTFFRKIFFQNKREENYSQVQIQKRLELWLKDR